jgi:hypothetical protein
MSLHALRRWISRHPFAWVLGLALAMGGAQVAAAAHEYAHAAEVVADSGRADLHVPSAHDCPLCLLAAALGGAAPAPAAAVPIAPQAAPAALAHAERAHTQRVALAYASRAPPASSSTFA